MVKIETRDITIFVRIMHLSDTTLPDWRIEKAAITGIKMGHEVVFGGIKPLKHIQTVFSQIHSIRWTPRARLGIPFYWHSVKKQLDKVLKETKPDLIHAHNIFSAKMISEFELPFVYDDHEYWSEQSKVLAEKYMNEQFLNSIRSGFPTKTFRRLAIKFLRKRSIKLWSKWEKEIVSSHPTITVSGEIAKQLRNKYIAKKIFVVPNFPIKVEVQNFKSPQLHGKLSSVYAGSEPAVTTIPTHRNIGGLSNIFLRYNIGDLTIIGWSSQSSSDKIRYMGFLSRQAMFQEMFNHSVGLVPWKKHWSHFFVSPNKPYEYAHAGLFVICTSSLRVIRETLKEHCITFEDYEDLASKLIYFKENLDELYTKRLKVFSYARDNLIWEKSERNILDAYNLC